MYTMDPSPCRWTPLRMSSTPVYLVTLWLIGMAVAKNPIDPFDQVRLQMNRVTKSNCPSQHLDDLFLPQDSVSHLPDLRDVNINPVFPNRTDLLHLQHLALSRSFFWSFILQSRFIRSEINDERDPGMMYYLLSTLADVSASPEINASAVYFAPDMSYTPSYRGFFNKTMPRFAPRTFRADDFTTEDLGATSSSGDYTSNDYRINEWYKAWLPDKVVNPRYDTKTTYQVQIQYANNSKETFIFHGPPGIDEEPGPMKWTRPYFDCGRSNRWLVAAVVPIADIYPRHTGFSDLEYSTYTAASVLEMDFERIDINQCPRGVGNMEANRFANTARCRSESTECEPLHGWGFHRGGYQCRCKVGFRLPSSEGRPYLGENVERATAKEYLNGFDCFKTSWLKNLPIERAHAPTDVRELYLEEYREYRENITGIESLKTPKLNTHNALNFIRGMNRDKCKQYAPQELVLTSDFSFGAREQFSNEARMAVRLANFISAFLQVSDPKEVYTGNRVADKPLSEEQMIGETLALVLGNSQIWSAATYWQRNKFTDRTLFAPYAYKTELNTRRCKVEDLARLHSSDEIYTKKEWFELLEQKWTTNFDRLEKFDMKMKLRFNETGEHPKFYRAAKFEDGYWTQPYFDCNGHVKMWLMTYAVPFFGWDSLRANLEFKGVVAVSMDFLRLDINQCQTNDAVPNAFKDTHKCDKSSTYCVPTRGHGYDDGGYKCECLQRFQYPFEDPTTYFDGQLVEAEFKNLVENKETHYDMLKCRLTGAAVV